MATHAEFVNDFVKVVQSSLLDDTTRHWALSKATNAAEARFAMGGDDDLYLNTALSLLHIAVKNDEKFPMAQPGLLKPETLEAVRRGVIACQKREYDERREQAKRELPIIFKHFTGLNKVDPLMEVLTDQKKELALKVLTGQIPFNDGSEDAYRGMYQVFKTLDCLLVDDNDLDKSVKEIIQIIREEEAKSLSATSSTVEAAAEIVRFAKAFQFEHENDTEAFLKTGAELLTGATMSDAFAQFGKAARAELRCTGGSIVAADVSTEAAALRSQIVASQHLKSALHSIELLESTGVPGVTTDELENLLQVAGDIDKISNNNELRILLRHALELTNLCLKNTIEEAVDAALPTSGASDKVAAIRGEFLRELSISTDKVWNFVRTVSGLIGEDATALLEAQDAEEEARAKQLQEARQAISKRVTDFQSKVTELLFAGMLKDSKLALSTGEDAAKALVVVDAETRDKIERLASGESGRPFFEANVALRHLTDCNRNEPQSLASVVQQLGSMGEVMQANLEAQLLSSTSANGMSTAALSRPQNSGFIRLRDDVVAAIRSAFDFFTSEMRTTTSSRWISLWELVEGSDHLLTRRFAELVGHVLVQNRSSTGVSALYVPRSAIQTTAMRANVALAKLVNQARSYAARTPKPDFDGNSIPAGKKARTTYFEKTHSYTNTTNTYPWASSHSLYHNRAPLVDRSGWARALSY